MLVLCCVGAFAQATEFADKLIKIGTVQAEMVPGQWYFLHNPRNPNQTATAFGVPGDAIQSAGGLVYEQGAGNGELRLTTTAVLDSLDGFGHANANMDKFIRFHAVEGKEGAYRIEFGTGNFMAAAPGGGTVTNAAEAGEYNFYLVKNLEGNPNTAGRFAWNKYNMADRIDNNGAGHNVVFWASGEITAEASQTTDEDIKGNNIWQIYDVVVTDEETVTQWMKKMFDEANSILGTVPAQFEIAKDIVVTIQENDSVVTDVSQFSSPYTETEAHEPGSGLQNLLDGNPATYWHSEWMNGEVAAHTHYLQITANEALEGLYCVKLSRRTNISTNHPTKLAVRGYDEDNSELGFDDGDDLGVLTFPYSGAGAVDVSANQFDSKGHTVFRFYWEESIYYQRGYWHCGDFNIFSAEGTVHEKTQYQARKVIITRLQAAMDAWTAAEYSVENVELYADATFRATYKELTEAAEAWAAVYVDPAALREAIEAAPAENLFVIGNNPGQWKEGTVTPSATVDAAKAYDESGAYTPAESEALIKAIADVTANSFAAANQVETGKWYRIKFPTEEMYTTYGWDKAGAEEVVNEDTELTVNPALFGKTLAAGKGVIEYVPLMTMATIHENDSVIVSTGQFSSPYTETSEGDINALLDGNPATFWHSEWMNGEVAAHTHYLQITANEALEGLYCVKLSRRSSASGGDHPTKLAVRGYDEDNSELGFDDGDDLGVLTFPYSGAGAVDVSANLFDGKGYTVFRFYWEESIYYQRGYWHCGDFNIFSADADSLTTYKVGAVEDIFENNALYFFDSEDAEYADGDDLFRFIQATDSSYIMQHKTTGLFVNAPGSGSATVCLSTIPTYFQVSAIGAGANIVGMTTILGEKPSAHVNLHAQRFDNKLVCLESANLGSNSALLIEEVEAVTKEPAAAYLKKLWPGSVYAYTIPVDITVGEGATAYGAELVISETDTAVVLKAIEVETIEAGTPYILIADSEGEYITPADRQKEIAAEVLEKNGTYGKFDQQEAQELLNAEYAVVSMSHGMEVNPNATTCGDLVGTFTNVTVEGGKGLVAQDNGFAHIKSSMEIGAFGAYVKSDFDPESTDVLNTIKIKIDAGVDTGINDALNNVAKSGNIYTVDGKLVGKGNINAINRMPAGVYIINGTKVVKN